MLSGIFCILGRFSAVQERTGLEVKWACFETPVNNRSDNFSLSFGVSSVKWEEQGWDVGKIKLDVTCKAFRIMPNTQTVAIKN